jgi:hypothetical protein
MQDVGWPEPAAVVAIMERMLSRFAFSLIASIVDADGLVAVVAVMKTSLKVESRFYLFQNGSASGFFLGRKLLNLQHNGGQPP